MDPQDMNGNGGQPTPPPAQGTPTPPPAQGVPTPPPAQGVPTPPPAQPQHGMPMTPPVQQPGVPTPPPAQGVPTPPPAQPQHGMPMTPPVQQQGVPTPPLAQPQPGIPMTPPAQGAGFPPMGQQPQQPIPVPPKDTTPANFQLGTKLPAELKINVPAHELNFDQDKFIRLLAGSISLSKAEKKKIVESIPKLKQTQIDELVRIFEEEKQKFSALSKEHVPQLEKLVDQHYNDWMDLEADQKQEVIKEEDEGKADEIRKSLGL